ncbi:MAG: glycoside hydrolase family 13 protein [Clostridia bacterium]|nr:glycoside hydrolase family 13 protein [Clostridia bacterium]
MIASVTISSNNTPSGSNAFPKGSKIKIKLDIAQASCERVYFYLGNDERVLIEKEAEFEKYNSSFSCAVILDTDTLPSPDGLYFCHFEFVSNGVRYYTAFGEGNNCYIETRFVNETQILIYDEKYLPPEWLYGGVMYQIFPDRFAKGGKTVRRNDAVYNPDWENGIPEYPEIRGDSFPNNTHFGGTLWGVADKLDYIESLGVNCIYLNPIFEAYSNHKYDTADFMSVDKSFGGDEALKNLIEKAHSRGIKIILDGVFNHVGNDSVYFDAYGKYGNGACVSKDSPYYSWFTFNRYPDVYESWWGIKNLPRTVRCESYVGFITEKVIPKYMNMGVDGFRLDVADELESEFLDKIAAAIKAIKPDALIIGEVWEDASNKIAYDERKRYFRGRQLDSVTDYPIRNAIIDFIKYGNAEFLANTINTLCRNYPPHKLKCLMNFLGSHDTERITTVLGGEEDMGEPNSVLAVKRLPPEKREAAKELLKQAYLLLAAIPGVPCIYYGDEIAMEGYHDPFNRKTFKESGFADSFSDFFKSVNKARRAEELFTAEENKAEALAQGVLRLIRVKNGKKLVVLANMSDNAYYTNIKQASDILTGKEIDGAFALGAKKVVILKTEA